ncbi:hypothetical protein CERSUDRAFT_162318 [Gelatoporia subvermispora B]|uniref:LYC1 C-terminal domain-containing protein n=1 Tax=Ceriporiopsis subvermispora (strain B) TaxID=914234 RepID=M2QZB1_CERS8|nr:hypothetical protein CERSUDRAFT_162318 [Gelatoporia subvermispora B]
MDSHAHATDAKLTTWVLAPKDDPTTIDFMCSCETMRRTGIVANSTGLSTVSCFAVASVYTPPHKRGRGYAGHMMRLLHWVLAPRESLPEFPAAWGAPPDVSHVNGANTAQFSVLYSDIGKDFYRECGPSQKSGQGWHVNGAIQTSLLLSPSDMKHDVTSTSYSRSSWFRLQEDDVKRIWDYDSKLMQADLVHRAATTNRTVFSFLPTCGVGAFMIQRTMTFKDSTVPVLPTDTWGVVLLPSDTVELRDVLVESNVTSLTYATWTLDVRAPPHTLVVTRLRATPETLPALLDQIVKAGRKERVERLEIWALAEDLQAVADQLEWTTEAREEHLSAFKWYGPEPEGNVEWLFNEKYAQIRCGIRATRAFMQPFYRFCWC